MQQNWKENIQDLLQREFDSQFCSNWEQISGKVHNVLFLEHKENLIKGPYEVDNIVMSCNAH